MGASFQTSKNHRLFILVTGLAGRLTLLSVLLCQRPYFLIGLISWVSLTHAIYIPAVNMIYRSNYRKQNRGVCYARAQMVALVVSSATALSVGRVLNWRASASIWVFAAAGLFGCLAYMSYVSMPRRSVDEPLARRSRRFPYADLVQILRADKFFRRYEVNFFIYGVAFMITFSMVPLFVNDVLNADWTQASKVFGVIHPLVMLIFLPLYGRLLDKTSVVPVASIAFLCLAFWPLSLAVASSLKFAYVAYFFFGLGMAGVDVAWMLGANTFADPDRIQGYTAIHVTLVGFRALMAPFLGLWVTRHFGFTAAFGLSGGLLVFASLLMVLLGRQCANPAQYAGLRKKRRCEGQIR